MILKLKAVLVVFLLGSLLSCDSAVDTLGIPNIPTGENYGSLTVSGNDTKDFGSTFSTNSVGVSSSTNSTLTTVLWAYVTVNLSGASVNDALLVGFNGMGEVIVVTVAYERNNSNWNYLLDCTSINTCLTGLTVDTVNKEIRFNNVSIPLASDTTTINQATADIVLSGTLSYAK